MPQLGESVTEGTIVTWLVGVGDRVRVDDPLVEVSTDKVDSEIPSPVDGEVIEILVAEGERVVIGTPIVALALAVAGDGEHDDDDRGDDVAAPAITPATNGASGGGRAARSEARAPRRSPDGRFLSPAVRARLASTGADPGALRGSGRGGRVSLRDLDAPAPAPVAEAPAGARAGETAVPFNHIRRVTAARMVESIHTSAHTLVVMEVDYQRVDASRQRHREAFSARHGVKLTYLAYIANATATALTEFPLINSRVGDDELLVRRDVNLGVAVDLDFEGLVVPVIHHADSRRVGALAVAIAELSAKAHRRALTPGDVSGATFTLTNAGAYGTLLTAPVISQPQVAILATDGISVQPVAVPQPDGQYALGFHPLGNLCLSFDHRAIDGAYASAFLGRIRDLLVGLDPGTPP